MRSRFPFSTISPAAHKSETFPLLENPANEWWRVVGDKSLDPWECFYKGSGHFGSLELAGGQHKSPYSRRCELRSFSGPIADAIILG